MTAAPAAVTPPCKPGRLKCGKHFGSPHQKGGRTDGEQTVISSMSSQLFLTPRAHVRRYIRAPLQSPRRRPKPSLTSSETTWTQSRPTSPSTPTPRYCWFPTGIQQNCHRITRNWYVEKSLWFTHWHYHWLLVYSSFVIWFMLKEFHALIPKNRTKKAYLGVKIIILTLIFHVIKV